MKKRNLLYIILFFVLVIPCYVLAEDDEEEVLAKEVKYYKTTTIYNTSNVLSNTSSSVVSSIVKEITEEEYNNVSEEDSLKPLDNKSASENNYSRIETTISKPGSNYRYKTVLTWKTMPTYRGYDIIAIGFYASVKITPLNFFMQEYCNVDGNCYNNTGYYAYEGANGIAAMFSLPSGSLKSMKETLQVDVEKTDKNSTIIEQIATGDYAHNIDKISYSDARDFSIGGLGIHLGGKALNHYDEYSYARAVWYGEW